MPSVRGKEAQKESRSSMQRLAVSNQCFSTAPHPSKAQTSPLRKLAANCVFTEGIEMPRSNPKTRAYLIFKILGIACTQTRKRWPEGRGHSFYHDQKLRNLADDPDKRQMGVLCPVTTLQERGPFRTGLNSSGCFKPEVWRR